MVVSKLYFYHMMVSMLFIGTNQESSIKQRLKRTTNCNSNSLRKYTYTGHTACISPSSSADLSTAGVTDEEIVEIVNSHNEYRSVPQASDMIKMSWDTEIAFIAQKWAENCQTDHDSGYKRRIPGRFSVGQNLAWSSNKMTWRKAIQLWYDEFKDFTYNGNNILSKVGHYTQVMWSASIKIGCGYVYCSNINSHFYACNYGPAGNFDINKPYKQGSKCGDCPGHCVDNLCECGKVCLNGGTLNLATCTCECKNGYNGPDCALDCTEKTDPSYCIPSYTPSGCSVYSNVPSECPHMCQFCPNAGISITGPTNGRGELTSFISSTSTSDCLRISLTIYQLIIPLITLYLQNVFYS